MKRSVILIAATLLAIPTHAGMAQTIAYSWQGTIERIDADDDPWFLGAGRKPFTISVLVEEREADFQDDSVPLASFVLSDVQFSIDGLPATSFAGGSILFISQAARDSASISLNDVEFNGRRDGFVTSVRLPSSTFAFRNLLEPPPVFPTTMTITRVGGGSDVSSYVAFVDAGVTVTAVLIPEPSTLVLSISAIFSLVLCRAGRAGRRRKTKLQFASISA